MASEQGWRQGRVAFEWSTDDPTCRCGQPATVKTNVWYVKCPTCAERATK